MTFKFKDSKTYHSISASSFAELIEEYDELVSQGYTRSDYSYHVPADANNSAVFLVSMLPPKGE